MFSVPQEEKIDLRGFMSGQSDYRTEKSNNTPSQVEGKNYLKYSDI